jgi:hypothetical protein
MTSVSLAATVVAVAVATGGWACTHKTTTSVARVELPDDLLVVVTVPSINAGIADLVAYGDRAVAGSGAAMSRDLESLLQRTPEIDRSAAAAMFVLDRNGSPPSAVFIVAVKDPRRFTDALPAGVTATVRDHWAVVADSPAHARIAPWALQHIAAAKVSPRLTATLFPAVLLAAHRTDLENSLMAGSPSSGAPFSSEISRATVSGLIAGLEQCDRLEATLELSAERAELQLSLWPRAKTLLAAFVGVQTSSDFPLLARLPLQGANMIMAGRMILGPLEPVMWSWMDRLLALPTDASFRGPLKQLLADVSGEAGIAVTMDQRAMRNAALYQTRDASSAAKNLAAMAAALRARGAWTVEIMGVKARYEVVADPPAIAGIQFHQMNTFSDVSGSPNLPVNAVLTRNSEVQWSAWDDVIGAATADQAGPLVTSSRSKAALPSTLAGFVTAARAHKASLVGVIDYAAFISAITAEASTSSAPMAFWLAFARDRGTLGLIVPSASVAALLQAVQRIQTGTTPPRAP